MVPAKLVELLLWVAGIVLCCLFPGLAVGEPDGSDRDRAGEAHRRIAQLAGDYVLTSTFWFDPAGPPTVQELPARREILLGGRVVRLTVGAPDLGFEGVGLMGFDEAEDRYWYTWTDTSTTGVSVLYGERAPEGRWRFEGRRPTPGGPAPLIVEARSEDGVEIHDYFAHGPGGRRTRFLELRYRRR